MSAGKTYRICWMGCCDRGDVRESVEMMGRLSSPSGGLLPPSTTSCTYIFLPISRKGMRDFNTLSNDEQMECVLFEKCVRRECEIHSVGGGGELITLPDDDSKGISIHRVVVLSTEGHFRGHVSVMSR